MRTTVKGYFISKLSSLGIEMSESDLSMRLLPWEINEDEAINAETAKEADKKFLEIILTLLVRPDISEDDYSVKYDRGAIVKWYNAECVRLGIRNPLMQGALQVKDMSFLA